MLAAPIVPLDVVRNLERLAREGAAGRYGYYEAIDYTPDRQVRPTGSGVVLPTYMAHHQGMSLIALDNAMQRRADAAALSRRSAHPGCGPAAAGAYPAAGAAHEPADGDRGSRPVGAHRSRRRSGAMRPPHTLSPRRHLLSNGSYMVMVTNAGGGYSRRQQIALTRWREDVTTDAWGNFCYVRDRESGDVWSTAYQPTAREPDDYEVIFAPDRAPCSGASTDEIETRTEIVVSPEDDAELRRVSVTNHGSRPRSFDVTSYAEVVLAPADADLAHPAFSNLFVETSSLPRARRADLRAPSANRQRSRLPRPRDERTRCDWRREPP